MISKTIVQLSFTIAVAIGATLTVTPSLGAQQAAAKPAIVLVHGAFADGSAWNRVVALLERDGYHVTAVQNALTTLDDDVATTKRVIDAQKGSVVLVGHSYGGAVITGAAAGSADVKALVYIAAMAPDAGEPSGAFFEKYPAALGAALRPDAAGFVYIDRARFRSVFAADVPLEQARVMAATQRPIKGSVFGEAPGAAAWKSIPSWYLVARDDKSINPDLERFYAKRMSAHTREISSSHVPFLSHAPDVVRMIEEAAQSKEGSRTAAVPQ